MKVLTFEKSASADHQWLKCSMPYFPISGAFDGVTGLFPDSSGRSARATSLTSSDPFNPLGHSTCCLIPMSQRSAFTADLFFSIQPLIAAKPLFSVGLPSAQCDGPRSPSPPLPRDRYHALPLRVVLPKRAQAADAPVPLSTGRIEAASRHTRIASVYGFSVVSTSRRGRGAMRGTSEIVDGAPGDAPLGGSMFATVIWEGINQSRSVHFYFF
jgi:hypothetical protein